MYHRCIGGARITLPSDTVLIQILRNLGALRESTKVIVPSLRNNKIVSSLKLCKKVKQFKVHRTTNYSYFYPVLNVLKSFVNKDNHIDDDVTHFKLQRQRSSPLLLSVIYYRKGSYRLVASYKSITPI